MALGNITIEGARIVFRNFSGKETMYNAEGDRNFAVLLPEDVARQMLADGWNVKTLDPRDEDEDGVPQPYIQVSLKYRGRNGAEVRPPKVVMITGKNRTNLSEDEVEVLDWADIRNVDIIIRPYEYSFSGRSGVKAYVQTLFVTVELDELEQKYSGYDTMTPRSGNVEE